MNASDALVRARFAALAGLLVLTSSTPAGTWISAAGGGAQGNPGSRHGLNVGGFAPVRGDQLALFPLLYSDDTAPPILSTDLFLRQDGALHVDTELRRAFLPLLVGTRGPEPVSDAELTISVSPAPESLSWFCSGSGDQCPFLGSGGTVSGITLSGSESFSIEFTIDFDETMPMPEFQVSAMIDSELEDPLPMDNSLSLPWSDEVFSHGFE